MISPGAQVDVGARSARGCRSTWLTTCWVIEEHGAIIQLFAGAYAGATSPAPHSCEITGLDVRIHARETVELVLSPEFEHAVLVLSGDCTLEGQTLEERILYYLGTRRAAYHSPAMPAGGCC